MYKGQDEQHKVKIERAVRRKAILLVVLCLTILGLFAANIVTRCLYGLVQVHTDITEMEKVLTNNGEGIKSSDQNVTITAKVHVKSSYEYMITKGQQLINNFKEIQNLGLFDKDINGDELWSLYYTYSFNEYVDNIDAFKTIAAWYAGLNDENVTDLQPAECDGNCRFIGELSAILINTVQEIKDSQAHSIYHQQLKQSAIELNLTEEDWKSAYSVYLISNPEFIKSIKLKTVLVNNKVQLKTKLVNWMYYGNEKQVSTMCSSKVLKNKTFTTQAEIIELLKYISITLDEQILDSQVIEQVPELLISYGARGIAIDLGETYIQNITGVQDVTEWLEKHDKNSIERLDVTTSGKYIDIGCGLVYWDILELEHIDKLPTFEDMLNNETWKYETALRLTENNFWQSVYSQKN